MKGIMFKEDLFRAILDGRKAQTRRVIKDVSTNENFICIDDGYWVFNSPGFSGDTLIKPRYQSGEILYMKEPYFLVLKDDGQLSGILYKFDDIPQDEMGEELRNGWPWNNKMFMPAKYARYFITITNVRAERLQDITRSEIRAEGLECPERLRSDDLEYNYKQWYPDEWIKLWNYINKPPYSWEYNPWVWVYEFELVEKQVAI